MKSPLLTPLLALITLTLAGFAWYQHGTIRDLRTELAEARVGKSEAEPPDQSTEELSKLRLKLESAEAEAVALREQMTEQAAAQTEAEPAEGNRLRADTSIMSDMAKMIEENPALNEMIAVQQRGTLQYLYGDLIKQFQLSPEESEYFLDLLLARQMQQVSWAMRGMGGQSMDPAEREEALKVMKEAQNSVRDQVKTFLNSDEDFDSFTYFEETIGVRMEVDNFAKSVATAGEPLSEDAYNQVVDAIYEGRKNYAFSNNFNSSDATEFDFSTMTEANVQRHLDEMRIANGIIAQNLANTLSPTQYDALVKAQEQMLSMQATSLKMAAQMFGGQSAPAQ